MDNRDSFLGGNGKAGIPSIGNNPGDKGKRFSKSHGIVIHGGIGHNRIKMGEIVKVFFNILGAMTFIAGILANLDNIVSVLLGIIGAGYGVFQALSAREAWLIKRVDRKEREDAYNKK